MRPHTRRFVAALFSFLALILVGGPLALPGPAQAFDLQGHRGARGLAPENTLIAFELALAIGVTTLELDVGLTADGVPVIVHDPHLPLDMTRDIWGEWLTAPAPLIHSLTRNQLGTYDVGRARPGSATARAFPEQHPRDGARLPTLAQLFERVNALGADHVRFNIETKINPTQPDATASPEAFVDAIVAAAERAGMMRRIMLQSFDWRTLELVQEVAPGVPTVFLTVHSPTQDNAASPDWANGMLRAEFPSVPHMVLVAGGRVWAPNHASLTREQVQLARGLGLQIVPWTVNNPADMRRLIDWGVDGLITDYPNRLREVMQEVGLRLPPRVPLPAP